MSLFGFNKSKQQQSSQSTTESNAQSAASSFGAGDAFGASSSSQSVYQADLFARLFQGAGNVAGSIATQPVQQAGGALFDSGMSFLSELEGMAGAGPQGAGEEYLAGRLNDGGGMVEQQIALLEQDMQRFYGETVMPGIRGDAIQAGGLGGSRQGVAEGMAARDLMGEYSRGVVGLRTADQSARDTIANSLMGAQNTRRLSAGATALAAMPSTLSMLDDSMLAPLQPYLALAQIMGGPLALTESASFDSSTERSGSESASTSSSTGQSSSQGSGSSFGFNLGWGS